MGQKSFRHISRLRNHASLLADSSINSNLPHWQLPETQREKACHKHYSSSNPLWIPQDHMWCTTFETKSVTVCSACDVWTSFPYHVVFPKEALEPNNQEFLKWVHPQQAAPLSWHSLVSWKGSERLTWAEESSGKEIKDVQNKKD